MSLWGLSWNHFTINEICSNIFILSQIIYLHIICHLFLRIDWNFFYIHRNSMLLFYLLSLVCYVKQKQSGFKIAAVRVKYFTVNEQK